MKKMKLTDIIAIGALCGALILTGCGSDKAPEKTDNVETQNVEAEEEKNVNPLGFENESFLAAVAKCFDKQQSELTEDDILRVRYLAVGPEEDGTTTVFVGLEDYAEVYFSEDVTLEALEKLVKTQVIEGDTENFADLGRFKNVEIFEYYNVPISDVSFIKNYTGLVFGYFQDNGITDVSSLSDYNPETLYELDFTGNTIEDWSPLYHIQDKIIVNYSVQVMTDETGAEVQIPIVTKLTDVLNAENGEEEPEADTAVTEDDAQQNETQEETPGAEQTPSQDTFSDIDWSVLFE